MKRPTCWRYACLVLVAILCSTALPAAEPAPRLVVPEGGSVEWLTWLEEQGSSAVLIWSSWTPGASAPLRSLAELGSVCAAKQLKLVVVAVQEPIEDSRNALREHDVIWLHDRRGDILKYHRVTRIPTLLVVDSSGDVQARLSPDPAELEAWSRR